MATLAYMPTEHVPVLAGELIASLDPGAGETAIDCTFGAGGHARLVAERVGPEGTVICIDRDPTSEERYGAFADEVECSTRFVRGRFDEALTELAREGVRAHVAYMDLGMSSMQLDAWQRGFSYAFDAALDMRMDPDQALSAHEVVNAWPQSRLAEAIRDLGEERHWRSVARSIVARRPIATTSELVEAISAGMPPQARFGSGHPARRTFQAVRIAVNGELEAIERALPVAWSLLEPGGRFAAVAFHSLEDRLVKRFIVDRSRACTCPPDFPICVCGTVPAAEPLTKGAVMPSAGEIATNPRSRSGRLRAARKIEAQAGA
ncbi:MAG: 16S rRNA (cytosine(1402)-N(4))-methyltransferase RsmH [Solirubrobacterales bacterium]